MADLAPNSTPLEQLFEMLKSSTQAEEDLYKPENLRYVLYARKSTTDETRQAKSKEDQIAECKEKWLAMMACRLMKTTLSKKMVPPKNLTYDRCSAKC